MTVVATKAALLLSAALLAGAALAPALVGVTPRLRAVRVMAIVLAVAVVGLSVLEVTNNLQRIFGFLDWPRFTAYLELTRHGKAVAVRSGVAVLLAVLLVIRPGLGWVVPKVLVALGLLLSFSYAGHAAAIGGLGPMLVDWFHYVAVTAWLGALLFVALGPIWRGGQHDLRVQAVTRLSAIGVAAVITFALTGLVSTLMHMSDPGVFVASPYGRSWLVKVLIVVVVLVSALVNRVKLVPMALNDRNNNRLRTGIVVELLLLAAVFVATGWLTTSALPHSPDTSMNAFENLGRFLDYLKER